MNSFMAKKSIDSEQFYMFLLVPSEVRPFQGLVHRKLNFNYSFEY